MLGSKQSYNVIIVYACARRRDRGGTVCSSTRRLEMGLIHSAVASRVRERVLIESYVHELIAKVSQPIDKHASMRRQTRSFKTNSNAKHEASRPIASPSSPSQLPRMCATFFRQRKRASRWLVFFSNLTWRHHHKWSRGASLTHIWSVSTLQSRSLTPAT